MNLARSIVLAGGLLCAASATAGVAGDALAKCLGAAATPADRTTLVRWMFGAFSAHPGLGIVMMTDEQRDASGRAAAAVFERLVSIDCAAASREAIAREGTDGFGEGFESLGELAMTEFVGHRDVQASLEGMTRHVDSGKVMKALLSR